MTISVAEPTSVVRSYLGSFASADAAVIAAHVAEDFLNEHTSALGDSSQGRAEYEARLPGFLASFVGVKYVVEDAVAQANRVMVTYTMQALHNGKPINIRGSMRFVVNDGLITRRTDYFDSLTFLRQTDAPLAPTPLDS